MLQQQNKVPGWVLPDPIGIPPQLDQVDYDFSHGSVCWTVKGDASQIDHFVVDGLKLRLDLDVAMTGLLCGPNESMANQRFVPTSMLSNTATPEKPDSISRLYYTFRVTLIPQDPVIGVTVGLSPALPVRAMPAGARLHPDATFEYTPLAWILHTNFNDQPMGVSPGLWKLSEPWANAQRLMQYPG